MHTQIGGDTETFIVRNELVLYTSSRYMISFYSISSLSDLTHIATSGTHFNVRHISQPVAQFHLPSLYIPPFLFSNCTTITFFSA